MWARLALYSLCIPGLPRTHSNAPVSSSQMLELQGCAPYPDYSAIFYWIMVGHSPYPLPPVLKPVHYLVQ